MSTPATRRRGLSRYVGSQTYASDFIAILFAPIISIAIFMLPIEMRIQLAFDAGMPSLVTAMTAPYVHSSMSHLVWNLAGYLVVVSLAYVLCVLGNRKRFFRQVLLFSILIVPQLTAGLRLFVIGTGISGGLSSIIFVFVGFLPIAIASYVDAQFNWSLYRTGVPVLFIAGTGIAAVVGLRTFLLASPGRLLMAIAGLIAFEALASAYLISRESLQYHAKLTQISRQSAHGEIIILALVLSLLFPVSIAISGSGIGTGAIDQSAHLTGYFVGYVVPYAALN